jgi:hypothetical protein
MLKIFNFSLPNDHTITRIVNTMFADILRVQGELDKIVLEINNHLSLMELDKLLLPLGPYRQKL